VLAFSFVLFGVVAFGFFVLPLVDVAFRDDAAPKPRGYRVRLVAGFAIAAAGVSIMFLNVSISSPDFGYGTAVRLGRRCSPRTSTRNIPDAPRLLIRAY
jgi:hypothetical protein